MKVAGFDLATKSGFALMEKGKVILTDTFKGPTRHVLDDERSFNADHEGKVGAAFEDFLLVWLREHGPDAVGIEEPLMSNPSKKKAVIDKNAGFAGKAITYVNKPVATKGSIFRIYGIEMIACTMCYRLNIPVWFIHQGTWRKEFCGFGNAKKPDAVRQCRRLGIDIKSEDAAEAVGVAYSLNLKLNPYSPAANSLFNLPPTVRTGNNI